MHRIDYLKSLLYLLYDACVVASVFMQSLSTFPAQLIASTIGHSWPYDIAGGAWRGAAGPTDTEKERYYCPLASIDLCQPPAQTNVVLDATAMNPCRTNPPITSPMGNAVAGQTMYIAWMGNGHTGSQSAGTCVKIGIAPYAVNPPVSAFTILEPCLPYSHGPNDSLTDANVMVPADLPSGQYTVWWEWDFFPFWFSDCGDINVVGASGAPTGSTSSTSAPATTTVPTTTTVKPTVAGQPATSAPATTTVAPTTTAPAASTGPVTNKFDCKKATLPNSLCQSMFGPTSFCMSWQSDKCSRSFCYGQTPLSDAVCP